MREKLMIALMICTLGSLSFFITGEKLAVEKKETDLLTMVTKLKGENIDINGWSLHAREKLENTDLQQHVQQLREKFPDWQWNETSDQDQWEATAFKASSLGMTENIQILSTLTKQNPQTYIIYEVQGKNVTQKTEQFIKEDIQRKISDIFRGNATIFSCIKGEFNDNMNTTLPFTVNRLLDVFEAKEIESLNEENFVSTSANSSLFADGLSTNNHDMNLQLGIRKNGLGAKTTVVVGTPIITIEY